MCAAPVLGSAKGLSGTPSASSSPITEIFSFFSLPRTCAITPVMHCLSAVGYPRDSKTFLIFSAVLNSFQPVSGSAKTLSPSAVIRSRFPSMIPHAKSFSSCFVMKFNPLSSRVPRTRFSAARRSSRTDFRFIPSPEPYIIVIPPSCAINKSRWAILYS